MNRARTRPRFRWRFAPVLPLWLALAGLQSAAAVEPLSDEELAARYAEQTLRVSVWLDKGSDDVYRRGEPLQVTFQANEDAYAVLYHIDVEGRVDVLWPTSRYGDGFVFGSHQYRLPAADGKRLRVGEREGLGYVQAVVSRYPFDLRDLPLDFFHESGGPTYDVYVAGDPYLAMNEVNFTVTGLEDSRGYVITNHVSYYVHRQVDHPRYLCSQCHEEGVQYEPYRDSCTITIRYDYGWMNDWWTHYRYYPVYYYPTYYYVDPWTGFRWVNYWYDPWYRWPLASFYTWPYHCYDWRYSPYWTWDSRVAYQRGSRRYTPLDRSTLARDRSQTATRTKSLLVTDARPSEDHVRAMKDRTAVRRADSAATDSRLRRDDPAGGVATNVRRAARAQDRFPSDSRAGTAPGLRLPDADGGGDARLRSRAERSGTTGADRSAAGAGGRLETRRSGGEQTRDAQSQVRPPAEQPRDGGRVWTNRRSSGQTEQRPTAPAVRPPARGEEREQASPGVNRSQDARRSHEGTARDRESGVRRPTPPPATPPSSPPASPPPPPPSRSRGDDRGSVRERAPQTPPPAAPTPPPPDTGRSGNRGRSGGADLQSAPTSSGGHGSSASAQRAPAQSGTGGASRPVAGGRR